MSSVIIAPWSKPLRREGKNPKNYPYWNEVVKELKQNNVKVIQVGYFGEEPIDADECILGQSFDYLAEILDKASTWCSVDNFFPHFASHYKKPGVVVWGKSDPSIFGYDTNINLLKDPMYLRRFQFDCWEAETYDEKVFVDAKKVVSSIISLIKNK